MSGQTESLYVGSAKEVHRDGREPFLRVEIDLGDLRDKLQESHKRKWTARDGTVHKVVALIVAPMKPENRTEYKTHSVKIDTWVPDPEYRRKAQPVKHTTDRLPDPVDDTGVEYEGGMNNPPF
jgi:hypothetical protein